MNNKNFLIIIIVLALPFLANAQKQTSLNGTWGFAMDPIKVGLQNGWPDTSFPVKYMDKVTVPHCFSTDKRYFFYTGAAWYFKSFKAATLRKGTRAFLRFDAVFYKTRIWLNGKPAGSHEGGYTPFELDVTNLLESDNKLTVEVNNEWDTTTIPGAKTLYEHYRPNSSQLYPWINYGGIVKSVHLIVRPETYISNVKITASPDLQKGTASIQVKAWIANAKATNPAVLAAIYNQKTNEKYNVVFKNIKADKENDSLSTVWMETSLSAKEVRLWGFDTPELYKAVISVGNDTITRNFGIRKIEVKNARLLLNGKPLKLGGANRPTDYPGLGSVDPDSILVKDLTLMKNGGMEFSRIAHHPVSEHILDWADENGMLIITEAGNWQMTPKQMADPLMRAKYQHQLKEMIERDWNHPSVVAYSMGNEFDSQMPEGQAWVKDMRDYTKSIDDSRLITFASYIVWRDFIKKPEEEASQYVDFISANIYGDHLRLLKHTHELYPNKPIFISEFGIRSTPNKTEEARLNYLKDAMESIRKCDYVAGASVWTFNDYLSRYPESDADGYRAWGLVTPQRQPREMYYKWQQEFAPAIISLKKREGNTLVFNITARKDFPAYTLQNYQLKCNGQLATIKKLEPGESADVTIALPASQQEKKIVSFIKPGGFTIHEQSY